jgi:hypothetical protein
MFKVRVFECSKCADVFEDLSEGKSTVCTCGGDAHQIWTPPKIAVHGCDSFNPHYDEQVGEWFETADHKKKVLKAIGREQVSGLASPKTSNKTSIKMTKEQAKKFDPTLSIRTPKII